MNQITSDWVAAAVGLASALGLMTAIWIGSLIRHDASLVDRFWGLGFVILALVYGVTAPPAGGGIRWIVVALVAVWGLRLSAFLTWRNWGHGEDYRYREMRARDPGGFPWKNLVTVHWLQGLIMWVVGLTLLMAIRYPPARWGVLSALGLALWVIGFGFESLGDWQLARFKAVAANRGRVLDRGVWRYTRHPNYFGDACVWWGLFSFAAAGGAWWTVIGPLVMTGLLLKVSGVVLLEKKLVETKPQYRDYVERTSRFIPWPPKPPRPAE